MRALGSVLGIALVIAGAVASAGAGGCGFVAGVDFFDLQRAEESAGERDAGDAASEGLVDGGDASVDTDAGRRTILHVLGGTANASTLPDAGLTLTSEIHDDGSLGAWTPGPDLPLARIYAPGIAGPDFVAMVGGISALRGERANFVLGAAANPDGEVKAFTDSADAFATARSRAAAVFHDGTAFVLGGVDVKGAVLASVQHGLVQANGTGAFAASPALPTPRARLAAAANDAELYVVGGSDGTTSPTDILVGHFGASDVSSFAVAGALPSGRVYAQAVVVGDALLVIGGESPRVNADVLRFPIRAGGLLGTPIATAPLPKATARHQLVRHGSHLYVVGGLTEDGASAAVFVGDLTADGYVSAWHTSAPLPAPLMFHTAVVL